MGRKPINSMIYKLLLPMCGVLMLGALLFTSTLLWSGSIQQLEVNAYDIFHEKVISRRNRLQNEMIQYWSNLSGQDAVLTQEIEDYLRENNLDLFDLASDHSASADLLNRLLPQLASLLRSTKTSGVFLTLNSATHDQGDALLRPGLYLRDLDPLSNPPGLSDLLLDRGSSSLGSAHGIALSSNWEARFRFSSEPLFEGYSRDFFEQPINAAARHPSLAIRDLGYWSRPFRLSANDLYVITYSVPLCASDGTVLGVLGTEISLDYFTQFLPNNELHSQYGGYLLAIQTGQLEGLPLSLEPVARTGPILRAALDGIDNVVFSAEEMHPKLRELILAASADPYSLVGAFEPVTLYNSNTIFESDAWQLVGVMRRQDLLSSTRSLLNALAIALLVSVTGGIFFAVWIAKHFTRPITRLADQVRVIDPNRSIWLQPLGISEIDELSSAIEAMSRRVSDAASRMRQIISLTGMPIAAFDRDEDSHLVYCTELFYELTDAEPLPNDGSEGVSAAAFDQILARVLSHPEPDNRGVYRIERSGRPARWLRVVVLNEPARQLGVLVDVTSETLARRRIEYERDHDTLTLLLNRRAFTGRVRPLFEHPEALGMAAFVLWDLDNLKYINDTYGHDLGDEYLRLTASALQDFSLYNGIVARMSGDEFYAFIYGYDSREAIREVLERIRSSMDAAELLLPDDTAMHIRASAGVAWYPEDATTYDELLKRADFAMYEVKGSFKGTTRDFDSATYQRDSFLLSGRGELNRLIDENLVRFAFQPIVDAHTGEIFAYEALMRPQVSRLGSPLDVLRLARAQSRLHHIERLTWLNALHAFSDQLNAFGQAKLFINSIPNNVLSDADFAQIEQLYAPLLDRLVIEIIESEQTDSSCCLIKQTTARRWNAQIALDDFGAGYSNDLVLLTLAPDYVKVDMSMVRDIDRDPNRQKLLQNLISYARERSIKVIAEGVQTAAELRALIALDVDYLQGYFLGTPSFEPARQASVLPLSIISDCASWPSSLTQELAKEHRFV